MCCGSHYIIIESKSIHYAECALEIPLNTTRKSSTYINHGDNRLDLRSFRCQKEDITVKATETCMAKTIRFLSRNHRGLS